MGQPCFVHRGDTLTALAKQYGATVETIAVLNNIADVNLLQTGQELVIPAPSQGITKGTALVEDFMNNTASSRLQQGTSALASYRNKSTSSVAPAASGYNAFQVPNLVKLALPLMLIAPVLGFCVRCVVDYIHVHINEEVGRRYAEMETYHARHRPKVKRWQSILDGDRDDSPDLVGVAAFVAVDEVRPVTDWWSQGGHVRNSATEEALEIETEEEQASRQQQDFEEIRKSYAELESTYSKFLTDSGLSRGGYWRGGVH
jgi:murein DD-endopeptidase MepM/ murein hydrolase activator NlpD